MPKNKKASSRSYEPPYSKTPFVRTTKNSNKDYQEIQCPICFEHPHDAVLLICSSYDKGCRPFMCDVCLVRYRDATSAESGIRCPLCRGHVSEERAVEDGAREFMNRKTRSCDSCEFVGNHRELLMHWFVAHFPDELARLKDFAPFDGFNDVFYDTEYDATSAYDDFDDVFYDNEYDAMSAYDDFDDVFHDDEYDATSAYDDFDDVFHDDEYDVTSAYDDLDDVFHADEYHATLAEDEDAVPSATPAEVVAAPPMRRFLDRP